jgi:NADH-quinone oxidoreductase subunit G
LTEVRRRKADGTIEKLTWTVALNEISGLLNKSAQGSVAIIASARQTNEELFLLKKLAKKLGATTDSIQRTGKGDNLLLSPDRNPNANGARLTGICFTEMGDQIPQIARAIEAGKVRTLIVFGEDVTKHGIGANLLGKLDTLIVSDILPNDTTKLAHYVLPGCAHAEKRGTFTNTKGRVQKFLKAIEPRGDARPEWEILHELVFKVIGQDGFASIEGLFNLMAKEVSAFNGLTWAGLGDSGAAVQI